MRCLTTMPRRKATFYYIGIKMIRRGLCSTMTGISLFELKKEELGTHNGILAFGEMKLCFFPNDMTQTSTWIIMRHVFSNSLVRQGPLKWYLAGNAKKKHR